MAFALDVHAIDSALTDHWYVPGRCRSYWFKLTDEVSDLKDAIEETFGTRAKDQRYHGLEKAYGQKLRFHRDRILQDCDDDDNLYAVLKILCKNGMINFRYTIAVVRIPIPSGRLKSQRKRSAGEPAAEGNDDSDDSDDDSDDSDDGSDDSDNDSDDSDVEVLRDVDTVQERIDAGRENTIVIGDEDDSSKGSEDEEEEQPPQKRARRANGESETEPQARRDGNGIGKEEQDQEREAANEDNNEEEEEANEAEEARADNGGDEGGNAALDVEAGGAEAAAAAGGEGVLAPAPEGPPAQSELRRWLRGLHADGRHANAFDAYAAAFEREFRSLEDLALAADNAPEGLEGVLRACGVRTFGDRARLRWAISGLPRPVRPAGVDGTA